MEIKRIASAPEAPLGTEEDKSSSLEPAGIKSVSDSLETAGIASKLDQAVQQALANDSDPPTFIQKFEGQDFNATSQDVSIEEITLNDTGVALSDSDVNGSSLEQNQLQHETHEKLQELQEKLKELKDSKGGFNDFGPFFGLDEGADKATPDESLVRLQTDRKYRPHE